MAIPPRSLRVKLALLSFGTFLVTMACGWLRPCTDQPPITTCYAIALPTDTPTPPIVTCYTAVPPTATPSPTLVCYTPTPRPMSPTPPSVTPQARQILLETLLAEGRFPGGVADQLGQ
ncbi:MAG: hypothetical protein KKA73_05725 [Chloroflexi bacterium]|nr:hypothetical protein [Chloroflexota bacterium]MBU1747167.1 hypothetical protein [Chloroflexota bacterium]